MNNQFKPGDLAIVVRVSRPEFNSNLGRVVSVIEIDPNDDLLDTHVSAEGIVCSNPMRFGLFTSGDAWINHAWLMPLRGDFAPSQQKAREVPV